MVRKITRASALANPIEEDEWGAFADDIGASPIETAPTSIETDLGSGRPFALRQVIVARYGGLAVWEYKQPGSALRLTVFNCG